MEPCSAGVLLFFQTATTFDVLLLVRPFLALIWVLALIRVLGVSVLEAAVYV